MLEVSGCAALGAWPRETGFAGYHADVAYFIKERGWLDLLGSIPSLGLGFKYTGLLRLARLSRLARITRLLRDFSAGEQAQLLKLLNRLLDSFQAEGPQ